MTTIQPPKSDQIEIIVFGPGYGECIAVHLGANRWMVVDSCIDIKTGRPPVLDYFDKIGINPEESVKLIVISHWHDDHIRGLSDIISSCSKASICLSNALTKSEFISRVLSYDDRMMATSSGVKEIKKVLQILKKRIKIYASPDRPILNLQAPADGSANSCIVTTLSPSDEEYDNFLKGIASLIPSKMQTKIRAPSLQPNNAAVVLWIESGDVQILLGSDLEEKENKPLSGWSAIVNSTTRPQGRASVFKVPHHGSETGHYAHVWSRMLIKTPIAILSPFHKAGKVLPTANDVRRILNLAPDTYITTSNPASKSKIDRMPSVERAIRDTVGKIRSAQSAMGWIRLQKEGKASDDGWNVQLSSNSCHLNDFYTTK